MERYNEISSDTISISVLLANEIEEKGAIKIIYGSYEINEDRYYCPKEFNNIEIEIGELQNKISEYLKYDLTTIENLIDQLD